MQPCPSFTKDDNVPLLEVEGHRVLSGLVGPSVGTADYESSLQRHRCSAIINRCAASLLLVISLSVALILSLSLYHGLPDTQVSKVAACQYTKVTVSPQGIE